MRKLTIILLVFCLVISTANAAEFSAPKRICLAYGAG